MASRALELMLGHEEEDGSAGLVGSASSHQVETPGEEQAGAAYAEEEEDVEEGPGSGEGLDFECPPAETVRRIESAVLWYVHELCEGRLPDIELASRGVGSRQLSAVVASGDGEGPGGEADEGPEGDGGSGGVGGSTWQQQQSQQQQQQPQTPSYALRPQQATQRRSLLGGRHPESAEAVARLFLLLQAVHRQLARGQQATQRELWYMLKVLEVFRSPRDVATAVQDAVCLLRVPRSALGVTASSKGLVAGRLVIEDARAGTETDCWGGAGGLPIPGDIGRICRDWAYRTDASVVLVIEKDAVFQRLVEERFCDTPGLPCILVTGKGVPDLATRAFLSCLCAACPRLALAGLVDWNPCGAGILCTYRYGSAHMGQESPRYALGGLGWLGARAAQLRRADADAFQELTARDRTLATNLSAMLRAASPAWAAELDAMLHSGCKAEIEALYTVGAAAVAAGQGAAVGGEEGESEGGGAEDGATTDFCDLLASYLEEGDCIL